MNKCRINKWSWLGAGVLGALGLAVGGWWIATLRYEARVVELRTEIALQGWPTAPSDMYDADVPRPDALIAALDQLRETPGRRGSPLAPPFAALLRCRGALTTQSARWTSELEQASHALDRAEFAALLAAIDAQPALGEAFALEYDERGFVRTTYPTGALIDAGQLVRLHAERALAHGRIDEAAQGAERALAFGQWLADQPSALLGVLSKHWRREGLCVLRSLLEGGASLAPERKQALAALIERARPDVELAQSLDSERVLWVDPMWEYVRHVEGSPWARRAGLEASCVGRPFVARAEIVALESYIRLRMHVATAPYKSIAPFDRSGWPELADLVVPKDATYFEGPADERRALDLAKLALAGLAPDHADAPRDPVTGAQYSIGESNGGRTMRAPTPEKPRSWSWPLAWPLRG